MRVPSHRLTAVVILLLGARASAASWGLQWARGEGAESCIDGARVTAAVEARLGRSVFVASGAERIVEGMLLKEKGGWRAVISLVGRDGLTLGTREHQSSSSPCASLDDGVILIIALLIDAEAPAKEPALNTPPAPDAGPPPTAVAKDRLSPEEAEPHLPPPLKETAEEHLALSLWSLFGLGKVGVVASGLRIDLAGLLPSGLGAEVSVEGWFPVTYRAGPGTVTASSLAAELAACPLSWKSERLIATACAGALLGVFIAQGSGFEQAEPGASLLVDVGVRGRVEWALHRRVALSGGLGAAIRLLPPSVAYLDAGGAPVQLLPPSWGTFEIGVGLSFVLMR